MPMADEIKSCERCGSPTVPHIAFDGAEILIPINPIFISSEAFDIFMGDRLRRAERIIVDLRRQLREHKCP